MINESEIDSTVQRNKLASFLALTLPARSVLCPVIVVARRWKEQLITFIDINDATDIVSRLLIMGLYLRIPIIEWYHPA